MGWAIFYAILLGAYVLSWVYSAYHPSGVPETITRLSGLAALLTGLLGALQKSSLRVYFLFQKILIRFFPDTTGRWWFCARFDGQFGDDVIRVLNAHFQSSDFRFSSKVESENTLTTQIELDRTLHLKIQYDPAQTSEDGQHHVTVISQVMEVSYGHAKKKLQQQIVPVLQAFIDALRPTNSSFELDVEFLKRNPFFAVYIAHLRPEQVQDYRVVLHVDSSHSSGKPETVEITKQRVHLTAKTTHSFQNIAEQFVLFLARSEDAKGRPLKCPSRTRFVQLETSPKALFRGSRFA
jgi:hypothetical protein